MPNWIANTLTARGPAADLDALAALMPQGMDFHAVLPMPPELSIEEGSLTNEARALIAHATGDSKPLRHLMSRDGRGPDSPDGYVHHLVALRGEFRFSEDEDSERGDLVAFAARVLQNVLRHGHASWYSWALEAWGSKWNANGAPPARGDDTLKLSFNTAWSAPIPVVLELSRRFPALEFQLAYFDEGWGFCGRDTFRAGEHDHRPHTPYANNPVSMAIYEEAYGAAYEPEDEEDEE